MKSKIALLKAPLYPLSINTLVLIFLASGIYAVAIKYFVVSLESRARIYVQVWAGLLALLMATVAMLLLYLQNVLQRTIEGRTNAPELTVLFRRSEFSDTIFTFGKIVVLSLCPILMVAFGVGYAPVIWVLLVLYGFYFPVAWLAMYLLNSIEVLNPVFIFTAISRTLLTYIFFMSTAGAAIALTVLVFKQTGSHFYTSLLAIYFSVLFAHLLGLFYCHNKKRLDWLISD